MGNVSQLVPSIHPHLAICEPGTCPATRWSSARPPATDTGRRRDAAGRHPRRPDGDRAVPRSRARRPRSGRSSTSAEGRDGSDHGASATIRPRALLDVVRTGGAPEWTSAVALPRPSREASVTSSPASRVPGLRATQRLGPRLRDIRHATSTCRTTSTPSPFRIRASPEPAEMRPRSARRGDRRRAVRRRGHLPPGARFGPRAIRDGALRPAR